MGENGASSPRRMRLATLLVGLNGALVLLAVLALAAAGVGLLERLADEQALARVRLAGAAARAAIERSGRDAATSARLLGERPTLVRLLEEGDRPGLEAFLDRFRQTSRLSGISVFRRGARVAGSGTGPPVPPRLRTSQLSGWTVAADSPPKVAGAPVGAGKVRREGGAAPAPALRAAAPLTALPEAVAAVELRLDETFLQQVSRQAGVEVVLARNDDSSAGGDAGKNVAAPPAREGVVVFRSEALGAYVAHTPLVDAEGNPVVWVEARLPRTVIAASLSHLVRRLLLAALGIAVLAGLAGVLLTRYVTGPVRTLTSAAARIGRGDLSTPVPRVAGAEIGELAATLEETRRRLGLVTTELRRKQAEGEAILTGVAEGVFSVDRDRRILYLNPQAAASLGVRPEDAVGRFCGDVLRPVGTGEVRPCEEQCPIVHARFHGVARATERLRLADGTLRTVVVTSSAPAEERQFQVLADETEKEAARRLRDAVLANISHEFKTPLAGQRASLELLRDHLLGRDEAPPLGVDAEGDGAGAADPVALDLVAALERGGLRLTQLVDNLLESVRIEAGSPPLRRGAVALDEVVEEAAETTRPLLAQRRQGLEVDLPYPLPEIEGDAPRLIQVFVNLLANANKFAPEGSTIRIGGAVEEPVVRLWVEDEGPGIPEGGGAAGRASLFERFVRSPERQVDPEASGMGLGLWIVQSIVERHGGRVAVARHGVRTRVVIALLVAEPAAGAVLAAGEGALKVLVVDDDLELLALIAYTLRQAGYLVLEARDGASALATFEIEAPQLVILDVNLPQLSGLEVCRRLRAASRVPIMMLTVRSGEDDQVAALDLGADDYLTKPFSPRTLLARVRALLRRAEGGAGARPAPLQVGDFVLAAEAQSVRVAGGPPVRLTRLELRLLQLLLANAGTVLPAERLLRHVWGSRGSEDRQLLKQLVHRLRQKIEADAASPRYLLTESGVGYLLCADPEAPL